MHWLHNSGILPRIIRLLFVVGCIVLITPLISLLIYIFPRTHVSDSTPRMFDLAYEDVTFQSSDGVDLSGWYIPAQIGEENAATIIFLHGYPAEKGDLLWMAYPYHDRYNIFMFDFRALGESGGWVSTLGYREAEDVKAAVAYVVDRGEDRIGVWGFSMGAAAAIMAANELDEVDAFAFDSSYAEIRDMSRYVYSRLGFFGDILGDLQLFYARILFRVNPDDMAPVHEMKNIDQPLLVSYSPEDVVIPASQAEKLIETVEEKSNGYVWKHDTPTHGIMSVDYQQYARDFFDAHLIQTETI